MKNDRNYSGLLSLGVFWNFPSVARNGSRFALFGYTKSLEIQVLELLR
jgi:formylmethanofuran dehydrogenase subunit A